MNERGDVEDHNIKLTGSNAEVNLRHRPRGLVDARMNETETDRSSLLAALPMNKLLVHLPTSILIGLHPKMKKVELDGGEFMYRPDENVEWIYFPETTAISELQILEDGRTIEVSMTGRESAVGLPFISMPGRSANWVQASAPGNAIKIRRDVLFSEISSDLGALNSFNSAVQSYVRQISQKVACNAHHSVLERFSTWLLMMRDRCTSAQLKLTQEYIARVLGVYRPSVTCIAQEMRKAGLIDYVRGNIVILDREGLKERSCGCYQESGSSASAGFPKNGHERTVIF
jgi:CRP-like cAMP-binding protein